MLLESYFKKQRVWGLFKDFMAHQTPWEVGSQGWECGRWLRQLVKARLRRKETQSRDMWSVLYPCAAANGLQPSHILAMVVQIQSSQGEDLAPLVSKSRHFPLPPALPKNSLWWEAPYKKGEVLLEGWDQALGAELDEWSPCLGPMGGVLWRTARWLDLSKMFYCTVILRAPIHPNTIHCIAIKTWGERHQWTEQTQPLPPRIIRLELRDTEFTLAVLSPRWL